MIERHLKKRVSLIIFSIFILVLVINLVSAAPLPIVGGDTDQWGTILNTYLLISHNSSGQLNDDVVYSRQITDGTIVDADISDTTNLTLGETITFTLGEIIDNIVNGWISTTGNLAVIGELNVTGNVNVTGNLNLTGNMTVGDTLFINTINATTGSDWISTGRVAVGDHLNVTGDVNMTGDIYIGNKEVGKDYFIEFHGEDNDGKIRFNEDNDQFNFDGSGIVVASTSTFNGILSVADLRPEVIIPQATNANWVARLRNGAYNFTFQDANSVDLVIINGSGNTIIKKNLNVDENITVSDILFINTINATTGSDWITTSKISVKELNVTGNVNVTGSINTTGNITLGDRLLFGSGGYIEEFADFFQFSKDVDITGNLTVSKNATAASYQLTGGEGLVKTTADGFWPFKYDDNAGVGRTGMYFDVGLTRLDLLKYLDVSQAWIDISGNSWFNGRINASLGSGFIGTTIKSESGTLTMDLDAGANPYVWDVIGNGIYLQNNVSDNIAAFALMTKVGDASKDVSINVAGVGNHSDTSPSESLTLEWAATQGRYRIRTGFAGGGGVNRELELFAGNNNDAMMIFKTDKTINSTADWNIRGELNVTKSLIVQNNITVGTTGTGQHNITLFSPDNSRWTCGVDNAGLFNCSSA